MKNTMEENTCVRFSFVCALDGKIDFPWSAATGARTDCAATGRTDCAAALLGWEKSEMLEGKCGDENGGGVEKIALFHKTRRSFVSQSDLEICLI